MTTNATIRTQFSFSVDDNTLGVILQRVQQINNDGVPVAAYLQVKPNPVNPANTTDMSLANSKCGGGLVSCNYVKLVPGTTSSNTSNDSIYVNRVENILVTLGVVYSSLQVIQILNPPQTLPGAPGAPSSILDTLNCPPDGGTSIEVYALYCGASNTLIVEVPKKDINRAYNILNAGQGNVCNRNALNIRNCNPFGCVTAPVPGYIPFPDKCTKTVKCIKVKKSNH
ncbi:MAG TPA: hypothetical protein VHA52_13010 [Candidatus Babeliaceae bacterium]|nr:hypothetical protein [Candidatus Babeliaceae bacterium]